MRYVMRARALLPFPASRRSPVPGSGIRASSGSSISDMAGEVGHTTIDLNGRHCNIPSILVNKDDTLLVKVRERSRRKGPAGGEGEPSKRPRNAPAMVRQQLQDNPADPPSWLLRVATDPPEGKVLALPSRSDVDPRIKDDIREQLIIEFCSR